MTASNSEFAAKAATMTRAEARRWLVGRYMLHLPSVQRYLGETQDNQAQGRPAFGDNDWGLRTLYAGGQVLVGVDAILKELETVEPGPAIGKAVKREIDYWEKNGLYGNGKGRFHQFDRRTDMEYFAQTATAAAHYSACAQRAHLEGRVGPAQESPKDHIEDVARSSIRCWLPAIQNIISRLPAGERQEEADHAQILLRRFHCTLADLHTLALKIGDERKRWAAGGVGAVDVALVECAMLIGHTRDLAGRMEDDGTDPVTEALRRCTVAAWESVVKALANLSDERLEVLRLMVWKRKGALLSFARAFGGITPAGEARYYKRGSMVPGY